MVLCNKIVELMNGHIDIESEVGKGSVFSAFVELGVKATDLDIDDSYTEESGDDITCISEKKFDFSFEYETAPLGNTPRDTPPVDSSRMRKNSRVNRPNMSKVGLSLRELVGSDFLMAQQNLEEKEKFMIVAVTNSSLRFSIISYLDAFICKTDSWEKWGLIECNSDEALQNELKTFDQQPRKKKELSYVFVEVDMFLGPKLKKTWKSEKRGKYKPVEFLRKICEKENRPSITVLAPFMDKALVTMLQGNEIIAEVLTTPIKKNALRKAVTSHLFGTVSANDKDEVGDELLKKLSRRFSLQTEVNYYDVDLKEFLHSNQQHLLFSDKKGSFSSSNNKSLTDVEPAASPPTHNNKEKCKRKSKFKLKGSSSRRSKILAEAETESSCKTEELKVLIVEDNPINQKVLTCVLKKVKKKEYIF